MKIKFQDILFISIISFLVLTGVYSATYLYNADEVSYDNSNSNLTSTNIQNALDELYTKCNNSTTTTPSNHTCTQKTNIKCKRATTLHTEICTNNNQNYFCQGSGYSLNDTITYGNTSTIEGVLTTGDAFDCDVNGDGIFDAATERFYYISDYFDTDTLKFNDKVAVLLYYSSTYGGVPNTRSVDYANKSDIQAMGETCDDTHGCNYYGPISAIKELPTTTQWSNISLYKTTRRILTEDNSTETSGYPLPSSFSYSGYAARLLTYQEVLHSCYDYVRGISTETGLEKCEFLFEQTRYSNSSIQINGNWAETPKKISSLSYSIYMYSGLSRSMSRGSDSNGTRPAIEVLKSEILY